MNWSALLTDSLRNIPRGYKIALAQFNAQPTDPVDAIAECAAEVEGTMQQLRHTEAQLIEAMDALRNTTRPTAHGARETDAAA